MEDAKKKPMMIGIIVVCLSVAAYITFSGGEVEKEVIAEGATIWMKCANIKCNGGTTVFEMDLQEYRDFQKDNILEETTPGAICPKCGKPSAFEAIKCPSCGNVFLLDEAGSKEFPDKCPKCQYSKREEAKKQG